MKSRSVFFVPADEHRLHLCSVPHGHLMRTDEHRMTRLSLNVVISIPEGLVNDK